MREWQGKRYWLVGASEGLGAALAQEMSTAGAELILSARNPARLEQLAQALPGSAHGLPLDVTDAAAVERAAEQIGPLDGVVFLAGVYWPFGAQDWDSAQANAMAQVNFAGAVAVMGAVLPRFTVAGRGHIVLTGSLSGYRGLKGAAPYIASKAGVMVLAESLYADLRGSGVDVQLINPGFIRTRLTDLNDFSMPFLMSPEQAATRAFAHMNSRRFALAFPRRFAALFRLGQFLPDWLYYRLFA
ncbi:MAG: SDR family NAD(P)-dependent oxidoreductase [Pelagimonas sp.]|jgi:short-subunit dehydrogenase|nr:SDR family NAD(P)-dependent oxidoreductase [Pelagimonas sp.]